MFLFPFIFICFNSSLGNINIYVGDDEKLHFVDSEGADTVIPFNGAIKIKANINSDSVTLQNLIPNNNYIFTYKGYISIDAGVTKPLVISNASILKQETFIYNANTAGYVLFIPNTSTVTITNSDPKLGNYPKFEYISYSINIG